MLQAQGPEAGLRSQALGLEEGVRDFLEMLTLLMTHAPKDIIDSHERGQVEVEVLAVEQEIEALTDARAELLERLGKPDPLHSVLVGVVSRGGVTADQATPPAALGAVPVSGRR